MESSTSKLGGRKCGYSAKDSLKPLGEYVPGVWRTTRQDFTGQTWDHLHPWPTEGRLVHANYKVGMPRHLVYEATGHLPCCQTDTAWEVVRDLNLRVPTSRPFSEAQDPGEANEALLSTWLQGFSLGNFGDGWGWWYSTIWVHLNGTELHAQKRLKA